MNVDAYLGKVYDRKRYNCWNFAQDVWKDLTGVDLGNQTPEDGSITSYNQRANDFAGSLTKIEKPVSPCLVLMQRARMEPHIGVLYKGRLLHLNSHGAQYRALEQVTVPYTSVTFYVNSNPRS